MPVLGSCRIAGLRLAYTGRDSSPEISANLAAIARLRLVYTGRDSSPEISSNLAAIARLRPAYTGRDSSPIYFLWEINRKVAMGPYPSPNSPPGCWI